MIILIEYIVNVYRKIHDFYHGLKLNVPTKSNVTAVSQNSVKDTEQENGVIPANSEYTNNLSDHHKSNDASFHNLTPELMTNYRNRFEVQHSLKNEDCRNTRKTCMNDAYEWRRRLQHCHSWHTKFNEYEECFHTFHKVSSLI